MIKQNKRILALILFVLISFICVSQGDVTPPPPAPSMAAPPTPHGPALPIDGGLIVGACFALFYGIKNLLKKN